MKFYRKYDFHLLEVGDHVDLVGPYRNITKAAYNWGRRYGIWLTYERTPDGARVTRVACQPARQKKEPDTVKARLQKVEEGVRFLCVMIVKLQQQLEDLKS